MKLHPFHEGRTEVEPRCAMRGLDDCAISHTCGVHILQLAFLDRDIGPASSNVMPNIKETPWIPRAL
jgi:hypothetical protein